MNAARPAVQEAVGGLVQAGALQAADAEAGAALARRYGTLDAADVAAARGVGAARETYEADLASARSTYDQAVALELED